MGWKPGKLLKKAFKGVRKVAKKIGKGIKKLAFKVFGALGKLGPLGQLALMFVGVPPIFGRMMGAVGSFVQSVAPRVYQAFTAIKGAAQGAFNTITEGIGNGIDRVMNFTKGKGLNLTEGRTSIFNRPPSIPDVTPTKAALDPNLKVDVPIEGDVLKPSGESFLETDFQPRAPKLDAETFEFTGGTAVDTAGGSVDSITGQTTPNLLDRAKNYVSGQVEEFKQVFESPGKAAGEAIQQGGLQGLSGATTQAIMGDPPTQKVQEFNPGDYMTPTNQQRLLDSTTWNGINTAYQQAGAYGGAAAGDLLGSFYNSSFANDTQYQQDMRRLGAYTVQ